MAAPTIQQIEARIEQEYEKLRKAKEKLKGDTGNKFLETFDLWTTHPKQINSLIDDLYKRYADDLNNDKGDSDGNRIGNNSAQ
ncbi:hypothetical protein P8815_17900 [Bacillus altitudinis]|uniref:hypothetical protein n=1 Tax=Bacillus TaxID=1386 RepID=UPI0007764C2D|nr:MULTISPECIES: hypothetical protein [Bacillus]AMM99619.1 hypothetical protein UP12_19645 [Bacillus pumilus]MEC0473613.1 hypothetical protein [Bacillus altitudinis]